MLNSWLVLLPPALVLLLVFATRQIILSLLVGIISAALIVTNLSITETIKLSLLTTWKQIIDIDNIYLFAFLFALGTVIALISKTGGAQALGNIITRRLKSARSAEFATMFLSSTLFIDDYLSCLTVGYVMRPIMDRFNIPRAKLAYLINVMTSPLIILAPISSWIGMIISQLNLSGVSMDPDQNPIILADPFFVFLKTVPFIFYSFIIIGSAFFIVYKRISFGPMHQQEVIAKETSNLFGGKKPIQANVSGSAANQHSIFDFLLPILLLVGCVFLGIPFAGDYWLFGGDNSLIKSFQVANIFSVLLFATLITLIVSTIFALVRNKAKISDMPKLAYQGIDMMLMAIITIIFAWAFGALIKEDLQTGQYLASLLVGKLNISYLPIMIFFASSLISIVTGTSWGTIAIMLPITIPMITSLLNITSATTLNGLNILYPSFGAILSGSVVAQISPISQVTIMTATSTSSYLMDYVYAQLYYILPGIIGTIAAYLISGFLLEANHLVFFLVPIISGLLLSIGILYLANKLQRR